MDARTWAFFFTLLIDFFVYWFLRNPHTLRCWSFISVSCKSLCWPVHSDYCSVNKLGPLAKLLLNLCHLFSLCLSESTELPVVRPLTSGSSLGCLSSCLFMTSRQHLVSDSFQPRLLSSSCCMRLFQVLIEALFSFQLLCLLYWVKNSRLMHIVLLALLIAGVDWLLFLHLLVSFLHLLVNS